MKIAIWHNLPSGGGKRALYHQVQGLLDRGHTVEAWCPPFVDQRCLPLSELIWEHEVPVPWTSPSLRRPIRWMMSGGISHVDMIGPLKEHCRQCAEEISRGKFDVLLVHPCMFLRAPALPHFLPKLPTALYLQEPYRWLYEALPELPWSALPYHYGYWFSPRYLWRMTVDHFHTFGLRKQAREELWNARAFDRILVNSLFSRESVLRAYGLESRVCYLGVDTEMFRPSGVPRENFLLGLGFLYPGKGIDRAIRAIGTMPKSKPVDLVWVANDLSTSSYQKEMEALAAQLGVNVVFKVHVPQRELLDLLNRASALIYTSRLEPFGFAPLEANACETPVVAIAEGGVRESVKDGVNGVLVNHDDPAALGEAIRCLLERPDLAREMGVRAREHVVKYWSWEVAVSNLERQLVEVCQEKKGKAAAKGPSKDGVGLSIHPRVRGNDVEQVPAEDSPAERRS